ncbi:hypothetical protein SEA_PARADIDDLES_36 [Streptomyces phage Paradiddles]|jgi:hypothetical protein|uniref:Uncharacterized protein n=1 Tax=Streptomyces phage Paradiddles TaxID=2023993 RepID=A0A222Z190_9CAUD|nr:hypothetical protein FDI37_gp213 [Streptomyces phage Paradiddles]UGL63039.1 hypothetical protein SEA_BARTHOLOMUNE_39 [Streptomyces phage Bartholomune]UOW93471.1 hypothetical protein SEA_SQUILLIUM_39 [Streptomyces phage Squillium]WNM73303.1 hypothetical protein SEA_LIANDRY_39 [Streptomyces phage Liandry]WNM74701.1 hypothetical protein SEA_PINKIEPIE_38 [Streptomyces phage PinkiePie]ASR77526.1 hypothetical protein SEA_PARADIDDLES_36 [Streptomyces phage Paradiddles]
MERNHRFYLTYELDGVKLETDELFNRSSANIQKAILEEDGARNVKIVKFDHLRFEES